MGRISQYSFSFKKKALRLSDDTSVKEAAEQLGVPLGTLLSWRKRMRKKAPPLYSRDYKNAAILLRAQGMTYREIAKVLKVSVSTAHAWANP